jgi:hypothetical protein
MVQVQGRTGRAGRVQAQDRAPVAGRADKVQAQGRTGMVQVQDRAGIQPQVAAQVP